MREGCVTRRNGYQVVTINPGEYIRLVDAAQEQPPVANSAMDAITLLKKDIWSQHKMGVPACVILRYVEERLASIA